MPPTHNDSSDNNMVAGLCGTASSWSFGYDIDIWRALGGNGSAEAMFNM